MSTVTTTIESTVPTPDEIMAEVEASMSAILEQAGAEMVAEVRAQWTGWEYKGRPPSAPRNVSQQGWEHAVVVEGPQGGLVISNATEDRYGRSYTSHVHRAGQTTPEADVIEARLAETWPAKISERLDEATTAAMRRPAPRRVRRG